MMMTTLSNWGRWGKEDELGTLNLVTPGLYHALKDNGVPVKFVAYPVSGHYPDDPVRQKDLYRRWVAWLDEYLL